MQVEKIKALNEKEKRRDNIWNFPDTPWKVEAFL